jgi:hypothetical protein
LATPNLISWAAVAYGKADRNALIRKIHMKARRAKRAAPATTQSPTKQLTSFIAKYDPAVAKLVRAARASLRKRLPTAFELVYDNYQFLAIGFGATERASDCLVSLAVSPKGVALSFYYGATLPDPQGILLGSGNQNRFVRLDRATTLGTPAVENLIRAAIAKAKTPLPATGKGPIIIKSVSAKQRPRRPAVP